MTIQQVLSTVDDLKPNQYTDGNKISWLSKIERILYNECFSTHEDDPTLRTEIDPETGEEIEVRGYQDYTQDTDQDTVLLVPDEYCDLYTNYIMAQMDYYNGEYVRYQNSSAMFNTIYQNFVNSWNREHKMLEYHSLVLF